MIKIRQFLRLYDQGRSKVQIAAQLGISRNTLKKYLKEFENSKMRLEEICQLSDKDVEYLFIKREDRPLNEKLQNLFSLFPLLDKELKRKGVTRLMLREEYRKTNPDGIGHSQFNYYFSQWKDSFNPVLHNCAEINLNFHVKIQGVKTAECFANKTRMLFVNETENRLLIFFPLHI